MNQSNRKFSKKIEGILLGFCLLGLLMFGACCSNGSTHNEATKNPVDMVYPLLDTNNSRWFFFSSACRPLGMVNLSPDTQVGGAWGSGYRYKTDTIKGFSHIHAWQLSGLSVMPITIGKDNEKNVFNDYYSKFSHKTEKVTPGYHYLELDRYKTQVELSSTKRVGFHKYHFPENQQAAILFNLNGKLGPCEITGGKLIKTGDKKLSGELINAPTIRRPKPTKVFFYAELSSTIDSVTQDAVTGNYLVCLSKNQQEVYMKVGISYTSVKNAGENLHAELSHWDFDRVVEESKEQWNSLLGRIEIEGGSDTAQRRFYTDLWHALQGRRTISDVNGAYPDNSGEVFKVGQLPLNDKGKPLFNHYNSDAFWGAQWTLNTLWGLVYPEIMDEFVHSLFQYYKDGGQVPRGPSGGNYTYVMTGASSTPFIVSAIQKGIVKDNLDEIYQALKVGHMPGGIIEKAGYEHKTSLGGGFNYYLDKGYVPYPLPEGKFGFHQDGASLTMEYAYQDWTLAQLAKKLGQEQDYRYFLKRADYYKNTFDIETGWMRPREVNGKWHGKLDPYLYETGFNESNGAQSTWFVPHDIPGLAKLMGGEERAVDKLNAQFKTAEQLGFTSGDSHDRELHPEYSRIPINYGNQPSIHTTQVFNLLHRPDLAQYWTRRVVSRVFSGLSPATGYNGDEDQGLMGSLSVLLKLGLFQMNGGTEQNPAYQIGSPVFDRVTIHLNPDYYDGQTFIIETRNNAEDRFYVKQVSFNDRPINDFSITHGDIVHGGVLMIEMDDKK
jgi:predicted alpha-1,2-mannosidase